MPGPEGGQGQQGGQATAGGGGRLPLLHAWEVQVADSTWPNLAGLVTLSEK